MSGAATAWSIRPTPSRSRRCSRPRSAISATEGVFAMTRIDSLDALRAQLRAFVAEREWDRFHNPKNLAMALAGEAGELIAHFQWLTPEEADHLAADARAEVELEIADVLIFLVELADRLGVDPLVAAEKKLALNALRYPVEKARGNARKYDRL